MAAAQSQDSALWLQRSFSQELRKLLEEARRDEEALSLMQRELRKKDEHLAQALADSAHLRARISSIESAVVARDKGEDMEKQLQKAHDRLRSAEDEVQRRDKEIIRMKQRIKYFEDEEDRLESNLKATVSLLEREKEGLATENRALVDQFSRLDQQLNVEMQKNNNLEVKLATLSEVVCKMEKLKLDQEATHVSLQARLKQEEDARVTLEKEVAVLDAQCETLKKENENLNSKLEKAMDMTNVASCNADSLLSKIQLTSEGHVKSSEAIATGILEHLKVLNSHMMNLEASFARTAKDGPLVSTPLHEIGASLDLALQSFRRSRAGNSSVQLVELPDPPPEPEFAVTTSDRWMRKVSSSEARDDATGKSKGTQRCVIWKWRWTIAALQLKKLLKDGRGQGRGTTKQQDSSDMLHTMEREFKFAVPGHNLVSVLLAIWRGYRRRPKMEQATLEQGIVPQLDQVLTMLPWWIRRVGEKRRLSRSFSQWHSASAASKRRQSSCQAEKGYLRSHSCFVRPRRSNRKELYRCRSPLAHTRDADADKCLELVWRPRDRKQQQQQQQPVLVTYSGSSFTARALRTLQLTLHQEFQDLQMLLAKEMEAVQNQVIGCHGKEDLQAAQRKRLTFLWEVCNNLATALMEAHKQLVSLDREFNTKVCSYLQQQQQDVHPEFGSPRSRSTRSPTSKLGGCEELVLFKLDPPAPHDKSNKCGSKKSSSSSNRKATMLNVTTTRKPPAVSVRRGCIASQCAAILQSEMRRFAAADRPPWS